MANYTTRTLFPPIVESKMDAFSASISPRLYFDVSIMNSRESFNHIQLSIHLLNSNINALDRNTYPLGFLFVKADNTKEEGSLENQVTYDESRGQYYINLPVDWIDKIDETYKLQIRLGEQVIEGPNLNGLTTEKETGNLMDQSWINKPENNLRFSEWSTICLIKPITKPTFGLQGFNTEMNFPVAAGEINSIPSNLYNFIGFYFPEDPSKSELLDSYRVVIEGTEGGNPFVEDSGKIIIDEYNRAVIQYAPKRLLELNGEYIITFYVESINGYQGSETYRTKVLYDFEDSSLDKYQIYVANQDRPVEHNSSIKITLMSEEIEDVDNFVLKRTSHRSNFKKWEDIAVFDVKNGLLATTKGNRLSELNYYDMFVESGVMYLYGIQPAKGARRGVLKLPPKLEVDEMITNVNGMLVPSGRKTFINHAIAIDFDHAWLIGEDEQRLDITYGMNISSVNRTIKETLVDTFGSQYPYITRNGNVNYRQFTIAGTITSHMDVGNKIVPSNLITLDDEYSDEVMNPQEAIYYQQFLTNKGIGGKDKYLVEREFRNIVDKILHDGKPKVFKTDTEGMILVRLMGVSISPKTELGRIIYDFSCNAVEVGPVDLQTLQEHKIKKPIPVFPQLPETVLPYVGQLLAGQMAPVKWEGQ